MGAAVVVAVAIVVVVPGAVVTFPEVVVPDGVVVIDEGVVDSGGAVVGVELLVPKERNSKSEGKQKKRKETPFCSLSQGKGRGVKRQTRKRIWSHKGKEEREEAQKKRESLLSYSQEEGRK